MTRSHRTSLGQGDFIGVMDSGLGGLSVLQALVRELPGENFRFFGDSVNAPYGEKTDGEVLTLTDRIVGRMVKDGAKAIVIACNTATSAAAKSLRAIYHLPIIGVEPALKPACEAHPGGRVLVMATPITLRLDKFQQLAREYGRSCEVVCVSCVGLASRIERGHLEEPDIMTLLGKLIGAQAARIDAVVLGCTHYPFVARQIREIVGDVPFYDGAEGTARQTKRRLAKAGLLNEGTTKGSVTLASSINTPEELALYQRFFTAQI